MTFVPSDSPPDLESMLSRSPHPSSAFIAYLSTCYHDRATAGVASASILRVLRDQHPALRCEVRVLDVTNELAHDSKLLATQMLTWWDTAKEEHKISRLADALLTSPTHLATCFLLDLASAVALRRPDLAERLVAEAQADKVIKPTADQLDPVELRIAAGRFLLTQQPPVRHFWQNHLRLSAVERDWMPMNARTAINAVVAADLSDELHAFFRDSVKAEAWQDCQMPAVALTPEAKPATLQLVMPTSKRLAILPPTAMPRLISLPRLAGLAASVLALAVGVRWMMPVRENAPVPTVALNMPVLPTVEFEAPSAPVITRKVVSAAKPKPATPAPTVAQVSPQPASARVIKVVPSLEAVLSPPPAVANLVLAKANPLAAKVPSVAAPRVGPKAATDAPPAATQVTTAKALTISDADRWLRTETQVLQQRYGDLMSHQQMLLHAPRADLGALLATNHSIVRDTLRRRVLLRWLALDPPFEASARQEAFSLWMQESQPSEVTALLPRLLEVHSMHQDQLRAAAWQVLVKPDARWSSVELEVLKQLAVRRR